MEKDEKIFLGATVTLLIISLLMLFGGIYMQIVLHETKAPLLLGIVAGMLLAIPLELWNFSDPDTLYRVMAFQDRFLMVCFGFAIGFGAILLYALNLIVPSPNFGIKSFFVPGVIIGGIIFGIGVGIAGYFPGTVWIALGQGRRDAIWALLGGLLGAFTWSLIFGYAKPFFWDTLNYGPITWADILGKTSKIGMFEVSLIFGTVLILLFLILPRYPGEKIKDSCGAHILGLSKSVIQFNDLINEEKEKYPHARPFITRITNESSIKNARYILILGAEFTITAVAVIILHQIFGESTTYSWIGAQLSYLLNPMWAASNLYFQLFGGMHLVNGVPVNNPFSEIGWEPLSDLGTFLGGLISATLISKRFMAFKPLVPKVWERRFGPSETKRAIGSFIGTFLVLFGARMANGCASGHILSGNIQMAVSSFVFMVTVLLSAWIVLYGMLRLKINKIGYR
ncbi:YeeE/YedE thiosulfate transporter family protein [Fervidicoccus fontis]|uniref:Putative transporter component n=1 Tax=Fervidicoccus fontis (strain DSM 19380 / JCM 18336 / VKM B-2539 / Kam940) TaxID=1163730 RepID=H9ZZ49_FERFK|nr:YeeE/YedE thiosulfate transporter family protein [Fervidicoccus fontis]AFH42006.1 putative transporter component [Fervidicoccus fontis Kam940]